MFSVFCLFSLKNFILPNGFSLNFIDIVDLASFDDRRNSLCTCEGALRGRGTRT